MIVHCANFGSLWWLRPGEDVTSSTRFTSAAAIFNTTGFKSGARERRNWTVPGVVRWNAGTCVAQRMNLNEIKPGNFDTPGLEHKGAQNRLLLTRRANQEQPAEMVLVIVHSLSMGRIDFSGQWRSPGVKIVSASAYNEVQETLLLIASSGEIRTTKGHWGIKWESTQKMKASLTMIV